MHKAIILGSVMAAATAFIAPASMPIDLGGTAQAGNAGYRSDYDRPRFRDRSYNDAPRWRNWRSRRDRREWQRNYFRARDFCKPRRRIKRELARVGYLVQGMVRDGRRFRVQAHNAAGDRFALMVGACKGNIIWAQRTHQARKRGIKGLFRKIRKIF